MRFRDGDPEGGGGPGTHIWFILSIKYRHGCLNDLVALPMGHRSYIMLGFVTKDSFACR